VIGPSINILLGLVMIGGALNGNFVFIGTSSEWPLVALGAFLVGLGIYRIIRRTTQPPPQ